MATWSGTIAASADDAAQAPDTSVSITGTVMNANSTSQGAGMRWPNVTIPQGSTINSATLTITVVNTSFDDPDVNIYGQAADNAAAFAATNNNVSSRTSTTAVVTWTASSIGAGAKNAPDLKTVVEEIVGRAGWSSGNALALIVWGRSGASLLRWNQYDNGSGAASLNIDYTEPPAGSGQPAWARGRFVPGMGRPHGHQGW